MNLDCGQYIYAATVISHPWLMFLWLNPLNLRGFHLSINHYPLDCNYVDIRLEEKQASKI